LLLRLAAELGPDRARTDEEVIAAEMKKPTPV
jgi:hypothetical protein